MCGPILREECSTPIPERTLAKKTRTSGIQSEPAYSTTNVVINMKPVQSSIQR
jgi:hypothetical protein